MRFSAERAFAIAVLALIAPACRATGAAAATQTVEIAVTNDLNAGVAAISIIEDGGIEQQLGTVANLETKRLAYTGSTTARRYRLRATFASPATPTGGTEMVSDTFLIPAGTAVAWTLRPNYVRTVRR